MPPPQRSVWIDVGRPSNKPFDFDMLLGTKMPAEFATGGDGRRVINKDNVAATKVRRGGV